MHEIYCAEARAQYLTERDANSDAEDWKVARWQARRLIIEFLRSSNFLTDIDSSLRRSGRNAMALRHFLAPPISQDQFKLICPAWSKSSENSGRPASIKSAAAVATVFSERRARSLSMWLNKGRAPKLSELASAIGAIAPLMASQQVATARRNRLSAKQESLVVDLLEQKNWSRLQSNLVSTAGQLPAHSYMHKTRFASGPNENQEVDIACGLGGTIVLAMECKVTNDETNSVKRINDILKKANAWKSHWGAFVKPAALLQGVIKFSDVQRLLDSGVAVFWTHRIDLFSEWIDANEAQ